MSSHDTKYTRSARQRSKHALPIHDRPEHLAACLILSRFLGGMAFHFLSMYGLYQLFELTGSPLRIGFLGLALYIPSLLLTYSAGRLVDRIERKGVFYVWLQGSVLVAMSLLFLGPKDPWMIYGASFLLSALRTVRTPALYSILSQLKNEGLDSSRLVRRMSISWQLPLVLAPSLFSVLLVYLPNLNPVWVLCTFSLLGLGSSLPFLKLKPALCLSPVTTPSLLGTWREFIAKRDLSLPLLADAGTMTLLAFSTALPFVLADLNRAPAEIGLLRAVMNGGTLASSLLIPKVFFAIERKKLFYSTLILVCLVTGALATVTTTATLLALCGLIGLLDGYGVLYRDALLLDLVRREDMGRYAALNQMLVSTTDDLGELRAGALAEGLGPRISIFASSLLGLSIAAAFTYRALRPATKEVAEPREFAVEYPA